MPVVCGKLYVLLRLDSKQVYNNEKGREYFLSTLLNLQRTIFP